MSDLAMPAPSAVKRRRTYLTQAVKLEIGELAHNKTLSFHELTRKYGVSEGAIYNARMLYRIRHNIKITRLKADPDPTSPEPGKAVMSQDVGKLQAALQVERDRNAELQHQLSVAYGEIETLQKLLMTAGRAL